MDASKSLADNDFVMETGLKLNIEQTADEKNNIHLVDIEDIKECSANDMMNTHTTYERINTADITDRRENIDVLKDMILKQPAEALKDLEKVLKSSKKDLSHYLSQIQRNKAKNKLCQNIKDDLILRTDRLLEMKRNLLETVYKVCSRDKNCQENVSNSESSRLSSILEERSLSDDEYFQRQLVVPKLDLNPNENTTTDSKTIDLPETQPKIFLDHSKENQFKYLENNGDYVVFKGYSPSTKFDNREMKNGQTLTRRIRNIAALILSTISHTKNKQAKVSDISAFNLQTGNDICAVMSDISVLSRVDNVNNQSESPVPKLDFSNLESPRKDTFSIPLVVNSYDRENSCRGSQKSGYKVKLSKFSERPNGQKEKNIFARFRSFIFKRNRLCA